MNLGHPISPLPSTSDQNVDPRKGLFSSAQTGSVNLAKNKFERKSSDARDTNYVLQV